MLFFMTISSTSRPPTAVLKSYWNRFILSTLLTSFLAVAVCRHGPVGTHLSCFKARIYAHSNIPLPIIAPSCADKIPVLNRFRPEGYALGGSVHESSQAYGYYAGGSHVRMAGSAWFDCT